MAKAKKTTEKKAIDKEIKSKTIRHRNFASRLANELNDSFWINRTIGKALVANLDGPPPFTFVTTIAINPTITIKSVNVNGVIAKEENFKIKESNIICTIDAFVSTFTFLLIIDAEGDDSDATTTFNITCDDKKIFDEDQEITLTSTGRGGYINKKVPLP